MVRLFREVGEGDSFVDGWHHAGGVGSACDLVTSRCDLHTVAFLLEVLHLALSA